MDKVPDDLNSLIILYMPFAKTYCEHMKEKIDSQTLYCEHIIDYLIPYYFIEVSIIKYLGE